MKSKKNQTDDPQEEIVYEENPEILGSSDVISKLKKVKAELKKCQQEKHEYLDGWQRTKADFVNLKKTSGEDRKKLISYANEEFILELLPSLDSFEQAFKNKESWESVSKDWRLGIEFIHSQLLKVLGDYDVEEINPEGEIFDANLHHSVELVKVENKKEDGRILEVIQKGYKLRDKIIRYPNVKVGEFKN
jgi:molecular chaperone GrpE